MELIRPGRRFDFMRQLKFWVVLSVTLALGSLVLVMLPEPYGPNYGTDFRGGTELEVRFKKAVDVANLRQTLDSISGKSRPDVVSVGQPHENRYLIRVQEESNLDLAKRQKIRSLLCYQGSDKDPKGNEVQDPPLPQGQCAEGVVKPTEMKFSPGGDKITARFEVKPDDKLFEKLKSVIQSAGVSLRGSVDDKGKSLDFTVRSHDTSQIKEFRVEIQLKSRAEELLDRLREKLGADVVPPAADKVEWQGPRAGKQLRDAAIKSVLYAIVFIMAYVAFRFDLRFAPGGILALFHDALVVLGVFVVTKREITLSTIAAILTIVGYSIADTVIIYDRIRENLAKHRGKTFKEIINLSVSETLSRTILTSSTVLLSVIAFFFYGTGVIRDFALALFVGVIAGTYSSIFVAAPLTEFIDRKFFGSSATKSKRRKKANLSGPGGARKQVEHQV